MVKLCVNLNNCFGIKSLNHEFNFDNGKVFSIYARNGLMKTSFAKTFQLIQKGKDSEIRDVVYDIEGSAKVLIDDTPIRSEQVFTVRSFESAYEADITSLLVNEQIRQKLKEVFKARTTLLKKLEETSGLKIKKISGGKPVYELEPAIVKDFEFVEDSILLNLESLKAYIPEINCDDVLYSTIFDATVLKKICSPKFQGGIKLFLDASEKIYNSFEYLEKGHFTYPKLIELKKSLDKNSFFVKDNRILLAGNLEITDLNAFESRVKEIETEIKKSPEYKNVEDLLADVSGRLLKDAIETHPELIEYLSLEKLPVLRKSLWGSYLKKHGFLLDDLLTKYKLFSAAIDSIQLEDSQWKKALDIFEQRFFVPFKMSIANLKGAIIGESVPQVEFAFSDGKNWKRINRSTLESLDVLSQGERRALYLLNIIFELEKIKATGKECVLIIDDIADSFDYKNKYAIIEYLYELANQDGIYMLILTHNYDFHRTLKSRLSIKRDKCLTAETDSLSVSLTTEHYQNQPFDFWKQNPNEKNVIALIPFVRNLCEYGTNRRVSKTGDDYQFLTSLLHQKRDTETITFGMVEPLYREYIGINSFADGIDKSSKVIERLYAVSDELTSQDTNLENKIVLAMSIRHKAEEFMLRDLAAYKGQLEWVSKKSRTIGNNQEFINFIEKKKNQTRELFNGYKQFGVKEKVAILDRVNIMTPEHIHINSFMYEPLMDMDIIELLNLYEQVKNL